MDAHAPRAFSMRTQRQHIAADVDERIVDTPLLEDGGRAIERIALGVATEVELYILVRASHFVDRDRQVAHLWFSFH